jgi:hypothetical protein
LYFYSFAHQNDMHSYQWWPRTAVYLSGWGATVPRFLVESTSPDGALRLSKALGLKEPKTLPEVIDSAINRLGAGMRRTHIFADPLANFDVKTIAIV